MEVSNHQEVFTLPPLPWNQAKTLFKQGSLDFQISPSTVAILWWFKFHVHRGFEIQAHDQRGLETAHGLRKSG